jgi:hypothetical protein
MEQSAQTFHSAQNSDDNVMVGNQRSSAFGFDLGASMQSLDALGNQRIREVDFNHLLRTESKLSGINAFSNDL